MKKETGKQIISLLISNAIVLAGILLPGHKMPRPAAVLLLAGIAGIDLLYAAALRRPEADGSRL